jgi:hypothetical protein
METDNLRMQMETDNLRMQWRKNNSKDIKGKTVSFFAHATRCTAGSRSMQAVRIRMIVIMTDC